MMAKLYWNTVTPGLVSALKQLMVCAHFDMFRLVGGTSLSLQLGHRESIDIDLFTDAAYDSIDFDTIDSYLRRTFSYVSDAGTGKVGLGTSYFVGNSQDDSVKLDLYYTDAFIQQTLETESIRMATIEEIIAMKIDIVQRGGRKKDFWDLHELMDKYSPTQMIALHKERYPYNHEEDVIRANFINFTDADDDFDPICLRGKHWEFIKLDIIEALDR